MDFFLFYELLGEHFAKVEQFGQEAPLEVGEVVLVLDLVLEVIL
jgi:hypothetical protein